jgi:hypothetical protein
MKINLVGTKNGPNAKKIYRDSYNFNINCGIHHTTAIRGHWIVVAKVICG